MAQTGIFVPAGVYLLDFLTLAPQRSSSNSIVPSISQIRLVGHARARPERSWVPAAPQALASCLAPTCRARRESCCFCVYFLSLGWGRGWG